MGEKEKVKEYLAITQSRNEIYLKGGGKWKLIFLKQQNLHWVNYGSKVRGTIPWSRIFFLKTIKLVSLMEKCIRS